MTLKRFICLLCDGTKGDGTMRRIRPAKLYACQTCVKEHNGVDYIYQNLDQFVTEFKARNAPRETRISFQSIGAAHPESPKKEPDMARERFLSLGTSSAVFHLIEGVRYGDSVPR